MLFRLRETFLPCSHHIFFTGIEVPAIPANQVPAYNNAEEEEAEADGDALGPDALKRY